MAAQRKSPKPSPYPRKPPSLPVLRRLAHYLPPLKWKLAIAAVWLYAQLHPHTR